MSQPSAPQKPAVPPSGADTTSTQLTAEQTKTGVAGHTSTSISPLHPKDGTGTIVAPLEAGQLPDIQSVRGLRLDQIFLLTTVLVVMVVVGLLATVASASSKAQFASTTERFTERLQGQAREIGQTLSHTLALTSATSLRDNNYAFLTEVARSIIAENPNILRVQMYDAERLLVADSDPKAQLGASTERKPERGSASALYQGRPVVEYQEPLDYGSQTGKGLVVISYSLEGLQSQLAELERVKRETLQRNTTTMVGLGLGFVVLAGVLAAFQSRRITRPLGSLTDSVMALAAGNLDARAQTSRGAGREVKTLGLVFNHMAERIRVLLEDVRTKAQLEREVSLARTVQETLLPGREPLQAGPVRVAGLVVTADACGGDWWLRAVVDGTRAVVGIGDVTGHGLSTALVATSATSGFAAALTSRESTQLTAQVLISSLNQTLALVARGEYQMTSALAVIDLETGVIEYAAGGHPAACVCNRNTRQVGSLVARGPLLGASLEAQYTSQQAQLQAGDVIVWYTDGVTESRDARGKAYGVQRLAATLQANVHLAAEALRDVILADVRAWSAGLPQQDDITVVIAEFNPDFA